MGYYVSRNYINVRLRKKFGDRVLEAVNSLFDENGEPVRSDAGECQYDGGKVVSRNYSWVQGPGSRGNFPSLETALKDWWHELEDSEEAGFWEIEPTDHHDKWGNDEIIIRTFLPFCEDGSEIQCKGEDDDYWGYRKADGKVEYGEGRVCWDWTPWELEADQ